MRLFIAIFFLILSILTINPVSAQDPDNRMQINLGNNQKYGIKAFSNPNANIGTIISNAIKILFMFGGLAVLVFLVWGAFDWITAGGDKEKIAGARRKIVNSLIGLALLALSYFIVSLFGQIIGIDPLTLGILPRLDDPLTAPTP